MNHLRRELAPISDAAWAAIDGEAKAKITTYLAARKFVDFIGPLGWEHSATNLGRVHVLAGPYGKLAARQRALLPVVELRAPFTLGRDELDNVDRGAPDPSFDDLDTAALELATGENYAVFHGYADAHIAGISQCTSHEPIPLPDSFDEYPTAIARAVNVLRESGVAGPYGFAIAPESYQGIIETTEHGGYPLLDHLRGILGGPVVWAPGVDGGIICSLADGLFVFECGEDVSIGYLEHTAETVTLYLEESFTFRVVQRDAAVLLSHRH